MSQTIHFGEKFKTSLMKYFALKSVTEHAFNHSLDQEFVGSDIVHVFKIATTKLNQYDKTVDPSKGSRFGAVQEVGDHKYTFRLTQDISLDRSVDRGNNDAQFNIKKSGAIMKTQRDEVIVPALDTYRLKRWARKAGIHYPLDAAPTNETIVEQILELHNQMIDNGCPEDGATLYLNRTYLPALKLSKEWTALDSLGGKSLPSGSVGMIDNMAVKPVSSRRMPANVPFMIVHKRAVIAPMKINTFRAIKDSENFDGDRLNFRMKHDAFVLPHYCFGVGVAAIGVAAAPAINTDENVVTLTTNGKTVYYTTDGSDPRYSADAKVYTAPFEVEIGDTVKCYAVDGNDDGTCMYSSPVAEWIADF
jgi:hypothetical protein